MPKFKATQSTIGFIIGLIADLISIFGLLASILSPTIASTLNIDLPIEIKTVIIIILAIIAIGGFYLLQKRIMRLDPKLKHLSIHYSSKNDSPNSQPKRPYYVKNQKTQQAYWVSDLITSKVKEKKIQYFTYKDESELIYGLTSQGVTIIDREPSDKELGLSLKLNGKLVSLEPRIKSETLEQLLPLKKSLKLERFQILLIFPKKRFLLYMIYPPLQDQDYPPTKRIILDKRTNKAYGAPYECLDLIEKNLIDSWSIFPITKSVKGICNDRKYSFIEKHYTIEEIISEASKD